MIAPEEKAAIARINGAGSMGLKTTEGKQASAFNAIIRGLRSENMFVLQNELKQGLGPHAPRLNGGTGLFDIEMDRQAPALEETYDTFYEGTRLASAFTALADETRSLALLSRCETRLRRNFERAVANLQAQRDNKKLPNEPTSHGSDTQDAQK